MNIIARIGRGLINFVSEFGQITSLLFNIIKYFPRIIKDKRIVLHEMAVVGADSLPLVVLIGAFTGAIAALQATALFDKFALMGVARPFIGSSIATVVFSELTPVLIALVIAGRVGGAIAAQIGAMSVSEQLDALEMMAIDKARYLGMPRVLAAVVMMPVLAIFSNVVALVGSYILTVIKFDFSLVLYFDSIQRFFRPSEIFFGMFKSLVFGGMTALIGCHVGFRTTGGAEGVGNSTVRAFTLSASAILISDAIMGAFF